MSNRCSVYFMRREDGVGPIKIGSSTAPARRMAYLMSWSPEPLAVVASMPGDVRVERQFHSLLAAHRLHFEWFAPHDDVLAVVADVAAGRFDLARLAGHSALPRAFWPELSGRHRADCRMVRELNRLTKLAHVSNPPEVLKAKSELFDLEGFERDEAAAIITARIEFLASTNRRAA